MKGRIIRSAKRSFVCELENGAVVDAPALASLLKEDHLVVGDFVTLTRIAGNDEEAAWQITEAQPRTSEIYRLIQREQKKKVTAANCDLLVIVASVSKPEYKRGLVDRYLLRANQWSISSLLILNKMDEYDNQIDLNFEADRLSELDVTTFEICSKDSNYKPRFLKNGFQELKEKLKKKTAVMVGQSGVGKSALISCLSEGKINLMSAELGKGEKGAHTTTWAEIVNCGDFYLIDSPGVRSLAIDDMMAENLDYYSPDVFKIASQCKFTNCAHLETSKGCAFNLLPKDERKTQLILSRLDSYLKFKEELGERPSWQKKN